jgi:hypothetical protein
MGTPVYKRAVDLLEAEIGDELVALDVQAGNCFGFNSVATLVWQTLEQPRTFDELQARLMDTYEVEAEQCAAELRELMADLLSKRLVIRSNGYGN